MAKLKRKSSKWEDCLSCYNDLGSFEKALDNVSMLYSEIQTYLKRPLLSSELMAIEEYLVERIKNFKCQE